MTYLIKVHPFLKCVIIDVTLENLVQLLQTSFLSFMDSIKLIHRPELGAVSTIFLVDTAPNYLFIMFCCLNTTKVMQLCIKFILSSLSDIAHVGLEGIFLWNSRYLDGYFPDDMKVWLTFFYFHSFSFKSVSALLGEIWKASKLGSHKYWA